MIGPNRTPLFEMACTAADRKKKTSLQRTDSSQQFERSKVVFMRQDGSYQWPKSTCSRFFLTYETSSAWPDGLCHYNRIVFFCGKKSIPPSAVDFPGRFLEKRTEQTQHTSQAATAWWLAPKTATLLPDMACRGCLRSRRPLSFVTTRHGDFGGVTSQPIQRSIMDEKLFLVRFLVSETCTLRVAIGVRARRENHRRS